MATKKQKKKQREQGLSAFASIIGKVVPGVGTVAKRKQERKAALEKLAKETKTKVRK